MQDNSNIISSSVLMAADCDRRQKMGQNPPPAPEEEDTRRQEYIRYRQPLIGSDCVGADPEAMLAPINHLGESTTSRGGESSREKLLNHWNDVAGRFCIPEMWSQEALLNEWSDCSLFDAPLAPKGVVSAREALVAEQKRKRMRQIIKDGVSVQAGGQKQ